MTHLRDAILALQGTHALLQSPRLPHPTATELLVQTLAVREARSGPPAKSDLEVLRGRLRETYSTAKGEASRRELRNAPWLFWDGTPRLAGLPRLLQAVLDQAAENYRTLSNLIEAWIAGFDAADHTVSEVGHRIADLLSSQKGRRLESWQHAHMRLKFFDSGAGPRNTAQWLLSGPDAVAQVLAATGLSDPVRGVGLYCRAVQTEVVSAADAALRSRWAEQALARALEFLAPDNELRFPDERGPMACGLTRPWRDHGSLPFEPARSVICDFLVRHLRDPRTNPGNWQAAGEETTSLVRQWLVRASLDMFFGLIAQFALDSHWQWRAAFWKACMDRCNRTGVPFDAWVALGPQVHDMARASTDLRGAYGRLLPTGVQGNHSVLLMRIGPLTLCEWSHMGALRAWPTESPNAPRLYRPEYNRSELTTECLEFPPNRPYGTRGELAGSGLYHRGSRSNTWQRGAASLLAQTASVRLTTTDWQPQ
jgi:hypothetical protein